MSNKGQNKKGGNTPGWEGKSTKPDPELENGPDLPGGEEGKGTGAKAAKDPISPREREIAADNGMDGGRKLTFATVGGREFWVGNSVPWPVKEHAGSGRTDSAMVEGIFIAPGQVLVVRLRSLNPNYRGQVCEIVTGLSLATVNYEYTQPGKIPECCVESDDRIMHKKFAPAVMEIAPSPENGNEVAEAVRVQDVLALSEPVVLKGAEITEEHEKMLMRALTNPKIDGARKGRIRLVLDATDRIRRERNAKQVSTA